MAKKKENQEKIIWESPEDMIKRVKAEKEKKKGTTKKTNK